MAITLKKQLEAFEQGIYLDSDGIENRCYNFYDWFCKDTSLKDKATRLFKQAKRFVKKTGLDPEKHYVLFKNNCPMFGPLYDDFRICDIETGDVVWTVIPKCSHSGMTEVWGRVNEFKEPFVTGTNMTDAYCQLHQKVFRKVLEKTLNVKVK